MNMPTGRIAVAAAIALLMPASLVAQGHQMGQMGMGSAGMSMQATDMPMMQSMSMRPGPRMLLAQREALDLSDAQVERLEALEERLETAVTQHRAEMGSLHEQFAGLRESEQLDVGRYEQLLRQAADRHVAMQVERTRIGQEALDVLDDQQRSNVRYGMRMRRMMMMQPGAQMPSGQRMMKGRPGGGMTGHGRMMAMMQAMQQRMQQMHESCPASSSSDAAGN